MFKSLIEGHYQPGPFDGLCETLLEEVFYLAVAGYPHIKDETKIIFDNCKSNNRFDQSGAPDLLLLFDNFTTKLLEKMHQQTAPEDVVGISQKIKENREMLSSSIESNDDAINAIKIFKVKLNIMKALLPKYKQRQKNIRLLAIGPTQVGKTLFLKRLFNLNDLTIKMRGGLMSDTAFFKIYESIINGISFSYTDIPGFFDTGGNDKNKENMDKLAMYIKDNEVDIILWTSKLQDIIDSNRQEHITNLTKRFGKQFWKRTLIVLTHANEVAPEEYYYNKDGIYDNNIGDVEAWTNYTNKKKLKYQEDIAKYAGIDFKPPVILTENHPRMINMINNVGTLLDGTPIIETVMIEIFKLLGDDKIPAMFLLLAGDVNTDTPKPPVKPAATPNKPQVPITAKVKIENNGNAEIPKVTPAVTPVVIPNKQVLTPNQNALVKIVANKESCVHKFFRTIIETVFGWFFG